MFCGPGLAKTLVFMQFRMPKAQKHCKLQDFYAWTVPKKYEKWTKNRPKKCPTRTSKTHLRILPSFFPPRTPKNVKTPAPSRIFEKVGAHPRVAKAMLSNHHQTARHHRNGLKPWCRRPPFKGEEGMRA